MQAITAPMVDIALPIERMASFGLSIRLFVIMQPAEDLFG
jgi:hypothetical protein